MDAYGVQPIEHMDAAAASVMERRTSDGVVTYATYNHQLYASASPLVSANYTAASRTPAPRVESTQQWSTAHRPMNDSGYDSPYMSLDSPIYWNNSQVPAPCVGTPQQPQALYAAALSMTPCTSSAPAAHQAVFAVDAQSVQAAQNSTPQSQQQHHQHQQHQQQLQQQQQHFEYRFNGDSIARLPRGALLEMGSPETAALSTPKRARFASNSAAPFTPQDNGVMLSTTMAGDVSTHNRRKAARGLHMHTSTASTDMVVKDENCIIDAFAPGPSTVNNTSLRQSPTRPLQAHNAPTASTSAHPSLPRPIIGTPPKPNINANTRGVTVIGEPRTPTPFKRALAEQHRKHGRVEVVDHDARTRQDLSEIIHKESGVDFSESPSKCAPNVDFSPFAPLTTSISVPSDVLSNLEPITSSSALSVVPSDAPSTLSPAWCQVAFGRTPVQQALTAKARRFFNTNL